MQLSGLSGALLAAALLFASPASGQAREEMARDLVHADLPVFGHGGADEWPQHFTDGDSFGCASRVRFGDWAFRETGAEGEDDTQWYRFSNYGVFHCWANTFRADARDRLESADAFPTFFVLLETAQSGGEPIELWAIQIGARPGSEYLLLSRKPAGGAVEAFSVLQTECPRRHVRDAGSLAILLTRYCAVNTRADLVRLARRMARRPPLGTLTLMSREAGVQ